MKKILAVLTAAVLVLSCTVCAFAATDDADASGEASGVTGVAFKTLPTKTTYTVFEDAGWDYSELTMGQLEEDPYSMYKSEYFYIDVDLTGAQIELTYADGTTAPADLEDFTTSVVDPPEIYDMFKEMEKILEGYEDVAELPVGVEDQLDALDEAIDAELLRDYTIKVEHLSGVSTTYNVSVTSYGDSSLGEDDGKYELVSYDIPEVAYTSADLYDSTYYDWDTDEEIPCKAFDVDLTGITAVLRDTETGELVTVGEDDIYYDTYYDIFDESVSQECTIEAEAYVYDEAADDYHSTPFLITVNYYAEGEEPSPSDDYGDGEDWNDDGEEPTATVESESKAPVSIGETTGTDAKSSTSDTATADTVNAKTADNGAVQTGAPEYAAALAVLMIAGAAAVYFGKKRAVK